MKRVALVLGIVLLAALVTPPVVADTGLPRGVPPVPGSLIDPYRPPADRWDPGHRGVDLRAVAGEVVVAAATGTVTYAGVLAGRGVVVVDHGTVRTTYEPVDATVSVGDTVSVGTPIGRIGFGGHCSGACLHWGLRSGESYLDPYLILRVPVRLLSADEPVAAIGYGAGSTGFRRPAAGAITSPYGWRIHPVLGTSRFHDGTDFAAACGSPIVAAAAGVVIWKGFDPAYGNRLLIDHPMVGSVGRRAVTAYNHAESYQVAVGDVVAQGDQLGTVGTTGWSTGCHLHFSVWLDGEQVDPETVL